MRFTAEEEKSILERSNLFPWHISDEVLMRVRVEYMSPTRFYHNWDHALCVLSWANHIGDMLNSQSPLGHRNFSGKIAALFHDVVYTTQGSPANEEQSVAFLRDCLPNIEGENEQAIRFILATAKHGKLNRKDVDFETALFLDCDMAGFGEMRWETSLWNEANITREFLQKYTLEEFKIGRKAFLESLLVKESLFLTDYFRRMFEVQARYNIQRLLQLYV